MARWENIESVQLFREYLRIESVHPNPDYEPCVAFFRRYAASLGLPMRVVDVVPGKPVVIITWQGLCPELPSIMLNSHMDVVPVYEEHWTHPPFSAHLTADGWIYARGSQDTKQLAIQHLEAVRRLMQAGVRLRRTVHVTIVPDEEIGGAEGMHAFTQTPEFRAMNVGLELDESMPPADQGDDIVVFYGERTSIPFKLTARAAPCHGALLPANSVGDKLHYVMKKLFEMRTEERKKLESGLPLGLVTSINLTVLEGGVQVNVVPESLSAKFDVRLAPEENLKDFQNKVLYVIRCAHNSCYNLLVEKYFQEKG
ncbi:aminoacylase-1 [Plutella xylostella]|uniref:aminoacylase-1 n=1 Tax=Plutella xylostella TaxID=51655 RepID=UPI002032B64B|nr:aminoacylase-1 [Plutella xylostella]